jgi:hypothetical protein
MLEQKKLIGRFPSPAFLDQLSLKYEPLRIRDIAK